MRLVRRLRGKEGRARCDATQPVVDRRLRSAACACACVRRAEGEGAARASWSHKCLRAGEAHYQRTKRKPTGGLCKEPAGACASARPPDPVARGRPPKRRARQDGKKKMPERRLHMGPPEPRGHLGPPKEAVKGAGKRGGGGLTRGTKRGW